MSLRTSVLGLAVLALALVALPAAAGDSAPAPALDFDSLGEAQMTSEPCNETTCGEGQFCCNYSCSICAPLGGACTQQVCFPGGFPSPFAEATVAEPEETPADTAAEATPEAAAATPAESPAVTEADLFEAVQPARFSSDTVVGTLFAGQNCNQTVCGKGQVCCSYSCSLCGIAGGACPDVICP